MMPLCKYGVALPVIIRFAKHIVIWESSEEEKYLLLKKEESYRVISGDERHVVLVLHVRGEPKHGILLSLICSTICICKRRFYCLKPQERTTL